MTIGSRPSLLGEEDYPPVQRREEAREPPDDPPALVGSLVCHILYFVTLITLGALTLTQTIHAPVLGNYCIVIGSLGLFWNLCKLCATSSRPQHTMQKLLPLYYIAIAIALIIGGSMVLKGAWNPSTLAYIAIAHGGASILLECLVTKLQWDLYDQIGKPSIGAFDVDN